MKPFRHTIQKLFGRKKSAASSVSSQSLLLRTSGVCFQGKLQPLEKFYPRRSFAGIPNAGQREEDRQEPSAALPEYAPAKNIIKRKSAYQILADQAQGLERRLGQIQKEAKRWKRLFLGLRFELAESRAQERKTQNELEKSESAGRELSEKLRQAEIEAQASRKETRFLKDGLARLEQQAAAAREEEWKNKAKREHLTELLHQHQARYATLAEESSRTRIELEGRLEAAERELPRLRTEAQESEGRMSELQERISFLENEKKALEQMIREEKLRFEIMEENWLLESKTLRKTAEGEAGAARQEIAVLRRRCEELEQKLEKGRTLFINRVTESAQEIEAWKKEALANRKLLQDLKKALGQIQTAETVREPAPSEPANPMPEPGHSVETTGLKAPEGPHEKNRELPDDFPKDSFTLDILRFFE